MRGGQLYTLILDAFQHRLCVQTAPKFASGDQMEGTAEEIKANYEGYVSYYGSYEFDNENDIVIHHVDGSLFPNWEGQDLKRFFELSGSRLKIKTPPTFGVAAEMWPP